MESKHTVASLIELAKTSPSLFIAAVLDTTVDEYGLVGEFYDFIDDKLFVPDEETPDESLMFEIVDEIGGGEGGGEDVERVVKISSKNEDVYIRFYGFYTSEEGTDWCELDDVKVVHPHQVVVTQYFTEEEKLDGDKILFLKDIK